MHNKSDQRAALNVAVTINTTVDHTNWHQHILTGHYALVAEPGVQTFACRARRERPDGALAY
jgi:hypothetical protein